MLPGPFLLQKYLIFNKMSKIADLTCKIMRKFLFPTYSSFCLYLYHAIYIVTLPPYLTKWVK